MRRRFETALLIALLTASACDDPAAPAADGVAAGQGALDAAQALPDASACSVMQVYPDRDGDGFYAGQRREDGRVLCVGEPVPAGFAREGGDCDDDDAQRFQEYCIDRDGDRAVVFDCAGSALPEGARGCPIIVEWTPAPGPYDCDDADPLRIDFHYRDDDRDGYGTGEATCAAAGPGWSALDGDCDDGDATRTPRKLERFGDGIDSDCDGSDQSRCVPEAPDDYQFSTNISQGACSGVDLALGYVSCAGCAIPQATFALANRGGSAVHTDVVLTGGRAGDPVELKFTIDLSVGEQRAIVAGPFSGKFELKLADPSTSDCRLEDNSVYVSDGHCI